VNDTVSEVLRKAFDSPFAREVGEVALLVAISYLAHFLTRRLLIRGIEGLTRRSRFAWDNVLHDHRVFERLLHLVPALAIYFGAELLPNIHANTELVLQRMALALMVVAVALALGALLSAANAIYLTNRDNWQRPIQGYLQIAKIGVYGVAGILTLATLMDRSPWLFLSGFGALSAVLLLTFRDTILSLVASIQITNNDMIHVGDWIEMPQYGADGDVIDVALHTVKVQNWDKTISTIPTHKFIEESFRNWRGMEQSGGRRIKRSIHLDLSTIRFLDEDEVVRFQKWSLLRDYVVGKRKDLAGYNTEPGRDPSINADIRRLTNVGMLRAYVFNYLKGHPSVNETLTLLVRQLDPTPRGLPLEIYCFTNDTRWRFYEEIQADIFDHIFAIVPEFGLRLFQEPAGRDWASLERRASSQETVG
jgi:miniconductance mechanosensitive channel